MITTVVPSQYRSPIDVRDFGAVCDNVTDDTAAVQAAINSIGDNTNYRAGAVYIPGICVISDTILIERKAITLVGRNWGAPSVGNPGYGSGFRWAGTVNTKPMVQFRQCIGTVVQNMRFIGNLTAANTPTAGISFFRAASGEAQPNTENRVEHCWFGQLIGYETTGIYLTNGILFEGANQNNDQTWIVDNTFYSCTTGVNMTQTQNVINHVQDCRWSGCGTGVKTVCEVLITNAYMFGNTARDLDINGGRVYANVLNSESSAQLAKLRGVSKLWLNGEYFQITNSLSSDGRIIDAVDDLRMYIDLWNLDLRPVSYTNPAQPVIAVKAVTGASIVHKALGLHDVTLASAPLTTAYLDVAIPGAANTTVLYGQLEGAADASGSGTLGDFWNTLKTGQATASFTRDDRTLRPAVTLTDATTIAVDASLGNTFDVTLAGNRTLGNPTNATDGQKLLFRIKQDATGGRTLAYGTKYRFGTDITGVTLSTAASKLDRIGVEYNAAADKFDVIAVVKGF